VRPPIAIRRLSLERRRRTNGVSSASKSDDPRELSEPAAPRLVAHPLSLPVGAVKSTHRLSSVQSAGNAQVDLELQVVAHFSAAHA